jgi:hypothetical protein
MVSTKQLKAGIHLNIQASIWREFPGIVGKSSKCVITARFSLLIKFSCMSIDNVRLYKLQCMPAFNLQLG